MMVKLGIESQERERRKMNWCSDWECECGCGGVRVKREEAAVLVIWERNEIVRLGWAGLGLFPHYRALSLSLTQKVFFFCGHSFEKRLYVSVNKCISRFRTCIHNIMESKFAYHHLGGCHSQRCYNDFLFLD